MPQCGSRDRVESRSRLLDREREYATGAATSGADEDAA
jgi:hypothetical protein